MDDRVTGGGGMEIMWQLKTVTNDVFTLTDAEKALFDAKKRGLSKTYSFQLADKTEIVLSHVVCVTPYYSEAVSDEPKTVIDAPALEVNLSTPSDDLDSLATRAAERVGRGRKFQKI